MKIHKISVLVMGFLSFLTLILSVFFSFLPNQIFCNIILAIFGSTFILCIHSLIMYFCKCKEITRIFIENAHLLHVFMLNICLFKEKKLTFQQVQNLKDVIFSALNIVRKLNSLKIEIDFFCKKKNLAFEKYFLSLQDFENAAYPIEPILLNYCSEASKEKNETRNELNNLMSVITNDKIENTSKLLKIIKALN